MSLMIGDDTDAGIDLEVMFGDGASDDGLDMIDNAAAQEEGGGDSEAKIVQKIEAQDSEGPTAPRKPSESESPSQAAAAGPAQPALQSPIQASPVKDVVDDEEFSWGAPQKSAKMPDRDDAKRLAVQRLCAAHAEAKPLKMCGKLTCLAAKQ